MQNVNEEIKKLSTGIVINKKGEVISSPYTYTRPYKNTVIQEISGNERMKQFKQLFGSW